MSKKKSKNKAPVPTPVPRTQDGTPVGVGLRVVYRGSDDGFGIGRGRTGTILCVYGLINLATVAWDRSSDRRRWAGNGQAHTSDLEVEK